MDIKQNILDLIPYFPYARLQDTYDFLLENEDTFSKFYPEEKDTYKSILADLDQALVLLAKAEDQYLSIME
jgi:uncharacterized phage-like protein YoqJ